MLDKLRETLQSQSWCVSAVTLIVALFTGSPRAAGCLWDRDTLAAEARGRLAVVEAIVGRFDRFPPEYFETRLARVALEIEQNPKLWGAYDDAAVACDRLGRHTEALDWIEKKAALLAAENANDPRITEHWYRYHANKGTFLAHRWFAGGRSREHLEDLIAGRAEIAKAIEINPDAHFGREKYQLLFMDWAIHLPAWGERTPVIGSLVLPNLFDADPRVMDGSLTDRIGLSSEPRYKDAVEGLSGLIVLGNAWESLDAFAALTACLSAHRDGALAYLARERCRELVAAKKLSIHPYAPQGDEFLDGVRIFGETTQPDAIKSFFEIARVEAETWRAERNAWLIARIKQGKHPDTDPNFWDTFKTAHPMPPLPDDLFGFVGAWSIVGYGIVLVAGIFTARVLLIRAVRLFRARVAAQRPA